MFFSKLAEVLVSLCNRHLAQETAVNRKATYGQIQGAWERLKLYRQCTPTSAPVRDLEYFDRLIFVAQGLQLQLVISYTMAAYASGIVNLKE
jgi:hypothetical protein